MTDDRKKQSMPADDPTKDISSDMEDLEIDDVLGEKGGISEADLVDLDIDETELGDDVDFTPDIHSADMDTDLDVDTDDRSGDTR